MPLPEAPDLSTAAKSALVDLIEKLRQAGDFAIEQAPEVIQQMVAFEATIAWMCVIIGGISLAIAAFLAPYSVRHASRTDGRRFHDWESNMNKALGSGAAAVFLGIAGVMFVAVNISTAIQATFYPKWFIVSRLAELIK